MRAAMFGRVGREAISYREPPARRLGVILSTLFLLSLSTIATLTTLQARNGEQDAARMPAAALAQTTTH